MKQQFRCELISWAAVHKLARELAADIRKSGFRPEAVVAIARGGYVPARILCDCLDISDLSSFRIVHYTAGAGRHPEARMVDGLCRDLRGRNVLLVDDVSDTGDTLELALGHLAEHGAGSIRIAVLHHKRTSTIVPDYYAHRIIRWRWIIYPWAVTEDISGFIRRMPNPPADADEALQFLRQHHDLRISKPLVEEILLHLKEK